MEDSQNQTIFTYLDNWSPTQLLIASKIFNGVSQAGIARELGVNSGTVSAHIRHMRGKVNDMVCHSLLTTNGQFVNYVNGRIDEDSRPDRRL